MGSERSAGSRWGKIVLVREPDASASKARPCVIVQRTSVLGVAGKITVCPITTMLEGAEAHRPFVSPNETNGLEHISEIEVDWIYTFKRDRIGRVIGQLDAGTMRELDRSPRRWLEL